MEVFVERFVGIVIGKDPVIKNSEVVFPTEKVDKILAFVALHQNLRGIEVLQQFVNVFIGALGQEEFARRNVEERHSGHFFFEMHRGKEVVLFLL